MHLDIAGTAWANGRRCAPKGGSGFGACACWSSWRARPRGGLSRARGARTIPSASGRAPRLRRLGPSCSRPTPRRSASRPSGTPSTGGDGPGTTLLIAESIVSMPTSTCATSTPPAPIGLVPLSARAPRQADQRAANEPLRWAAAAHRAGLPVGGAKRVQIFRAPIAALALALAAAVARDRARAVGHAARRSSAGCRRRHSPTRPGDPRDGCRGGTRGRGAARAARARAAADPLGGGALLLASLPGWFVRVFPGGRRGPRARALGAPPRAPVRGAS